MGDPFGIIVTLFAYSIHCFMFNPFSDTHHNHNLNIYRPLGDVYRTDSVRLVRSRLYWGPTCTWNDCDHDEPQVSEFRAKRKQPKHINHSWSLVPAFSLHPHHYHLKLIAQLQVDLRYMRRQLACGSLPSLSLILWLHFLVGLGSRLHILPLTLTSE